MAVYRAQLMSTGLAIRLHSAPCHRAAPADIGFHAAATTVQQETPCALSCGPDCLGFGSAAVPPRPRFSTLCVSPQSASGIRSSARLPALTRGWPLRLSATATSVVLLRWRALLSPQLSRHSHTG